MDARYYITLEKFVNKGDRAVVYTHGGYFVAVIEFVTRWFYSEEDIGWSKHGRKYIFPYRIKFRILCEAKKPLKIHYSTEERDLKANWVKPNFIDKISFIADKGRTWNQYFQVSIIRITEEDFITISNAIEERS